MSYGKMANSFIEIIEVKPGKDADGFAVCTDNIIANVRAYREDKNGTTMWKNRAVFATATTLFRFRKIPGVSVSTANIIVCEDGRYTILNVEDVRNRGLYIEIIAERVNPSG